MTLERQMKLTLEAIRDFVTRGLKAQRAVDEVVLMRRARECLARWAAVRARNTRVRKRVAETNKLIDEIDEWLLRL